MKILGIETTCDETAAAVVEDGHTILSNVVASQIDIHAEFGGVVPEVAARSHLEVMIPIVEKALKEASSDWKDIDGIAVANGPGLLGSLLIGTLTARTLAEIKSKPLLPINHVEAHVYAAFTTPDEPKFPLLALIVSGGHTQLALFQGHGDYQLLGQTHDDAAGEAFDKVAKILGLPYPGGPSVSAAATKGNDRSFSFPKPKIDNDSLGFSFSGLKTAVLRAAQSAVGGDFRTPSHELPERLIDQQKYDIAASFQRTAVEILAGKLEEAYRKHQPASVVLAGGVAANKNLREEIAKRILDAIYAPLNLCTDNAAMIAALGYFQAQRQKFETPDQVRALPVLSM